MEETLQAKTQVLNDEIMRLSELKSKYGKKKKEFEEKEKEFKSSETTADENAEIEHLLTCPLETLQQILESVRNKGKTLDPISKLSEEEVKQKEAFSKMESMKKQNLELETEIKAQEEKLAALKGNLRKQ